MTIENMYRAVNERASLDNLFNQYAIIIDRSNSAEQIVDTKGKASQEVIDAVKQIQKNRRLQWVETAGKPASRLRTVKPL